MTKISCDVVKDLIPLYVDDVLSSDSKKLVDEHLQSCEKCREYCKALSENTVLTPVRTEKERAVIKKIKRRINIKRLITAGIAAGIVVAFAFSMYYAVFVREQYLSFDESGVYVDNGIMKTKREYQCFYGFDEQDDKNALYVYVTTTPYRKHQKKDAITEMFDISDADREISAIYYIPQEYVRDFKDYVNGLTEEKLNEMRDAFPLVWSGN